MIRHSVQSKDPTFVKEYELLFFAKNMSKYICRNITKNLSSRYRKKTSGSH